MKPRSQAQHVSGESKHRLAVSAILCMLPLVMMGSSLAADGKMPAKNTSIVYAALGVFGLLVRYWPQLGGGRA